MKNGPAVDITLCLLPETETKAGKYTGNMEAGDAPKIDLHQSNVFEEQRRRSATEYLSLIHI